MSKAQLVKIIINHPFEFDKAAFAHKIGRIGEVIGLDQTDFVESTHLRFADGTVGVFLDEEIKPVEEPYGFESTEALRAAYPNVKLRVAIEEVQIAEAIDDEGRAIQFISHDRQHWWGAIVSPTAEGKDE